ncbi:unnamed protein product [Lupinus luteus]|uniref:Uncharacterized protein n=1 Tax=Lupinus luteus TaxID=3873 RepID=A0AAV1XHS1_LUPLU
MSFTWLNIKRILCHSHGNGLPGMRRRDLIKWHVNQQNEKNKYNIMEEAAKEKFTTLKLLQRYTFVFIQEFIILLEGEYCMLTISNTCTSQSLFGGEDHLIVDDGMEESTQAAYAEQPT